MLLTLISINRKPSFMPTWEEASNRIGSLLKGTEGMDSQSCPGLGRRPEEAPAPAAAADSEMTDLVPGDGQKKADAPTSAEGRRNSSSGSVDLDGVADGSAVVRGKFSEPYVLLRRILREELGGGGGGGEHRLLVSAAHAVMQESGFVAVDPATGMPADQRPPSTAFAMSVWYSLPELVAREQGLNMSERVLLKFQSLGNGDDDDEAEANEDGGSSTSYPLKEVFEFWMLVIKTCFAVAVPKQPRCASRENHRLRHANPLIAERSRPMPPVLPSDADRACPPPRPNRRWPPGPEPPRLASTMREAFLAFHFGSTSLAYCSGEYVCGCPCDWKLSGRYCVFSCSSPNPPSIIKLFVKVDLFLTPAMSHYLFILLKVTGEPLIQHKDDTAAILKSRLQAFHKQVMRHGKHKERTLKDQMAKDPTEVIRKAVLRMLPRNKLRDVSEGPIFF
ncbi:hypothetical protein NL676_015842 [Syzygium grande]|nr:hypothetical protein NL676_015842 [Syzygium grande]